jgi:hypothetical protein
MAKLRNEGPANYQEVTNKPSILELYWSPVTEKTGEKILSTPGLSPSQKCPIQQYTMAQGASEAIVNSQK